MAKYHKYKNENPKSKDTGDCVVRALATATDKSWDYVYSELCKIGFGLKVMPNSKESYETYLINNGFERQKITIKKGDKRPTVLSFTKAHKVGVYVLSVANHLSVCKDGIYYDTWDCGDSCVYTYWSRG